MSQTELSRVVIKFTGDSGDGMQLTGNQYTLASAAFGNDVATLPDYPSEIRAPAGTISGVSGFQMQFGDGKVNSPGDFPDVLVAMNPAALKVNGKFVKPGGIILTDIDAYTESNLTKAGYTEDPFAAPELDGKKVLKVPMTSQVVAALEAFDAPRKAKEKCKNFFTLGVLFWMYDLAPEHNIAWMKEKWKSKPQLVEMNETAIKAGMIYAENSTGMAQHRYRIKPAELPAGTYRNLTGNDATAIALVTASKLAGVDMFLGTYPITPATDILHEYAKYKQFGVKSHQAEDEIAGICSAIGAAHAGVLAATTTSGPGMALNAEAMGLAAISEIPLVIVNVQRGGPSTGLPTKTEQADLMQAMYCRNGEAPIPIIAAKSPSDCFHQTLEAVRIATKYMTPVILLTDGYIGQGSEPFRVPSLDELPQIDVKFRTEAESEYLPYARDEKTLAREWVKPGTPGLQNRIGGLEKDFLTGAVSHDPVNHQKMVDVRAAKVDGIADDIPELEIYGDQDGGDVLIVGWGSTYGSIKNSVDKYRAQGKSVSQAHFTHIYPFPKNTEEVLKKFRHVVVTEINAGQLNELLRAKFEVHTEQINKVQGLPFREHEIAEVIDTLI
nr:2-oxoacid:acceptor oxidoreductase subunit alpha [Trichlorobacter lovleyi]